MKKVVFILVAFATAIAWVVGPKIFGYNSIYVVIFYLSLVFMTIVMKYLPSSNKDSFFLIGMITLIVITPCVRNYVSFLEFGLLNFFEALMIFCVIIPIALFSLLLGESKEKEKNGNMSVVKDKSE